jgi:hypothetical protein
MIRWLFLFGYTLLVTANPLPGQELEGYVLDKNGTPIAYAHVVTENGKEGTYSNENGYFFLAASKQQIGKPVSISHVNFQSQKIEFWESGISIKIILERVPTPTLEIVVSPVNAANLLENFHKKFISNYGFQKFGATMLLRSVIYIQKGDQFVPVIIKEADFLYYIDDYYRSILVSPMSIETSVVEQADSVTFGLVQEFPFRHLLTRNICHPSFMGEFLAKDASKSYIFSPSNTDFDSHIFAFKPKNKKAVFEGDFVISDTSYSISEANIRWNIHEIKRQEFRLKFNTVLNGIQIKINDDFSTSRYVYEKSIRKWVLHSILRSTEFSLAKNKWGDEQRILVVNQLFVPAYHAITNVDTIDWISPENFKWSQGEISQEPSKTELRKFTFPRVVPIPVKK